MRLLRFKAQNLFSLGNVDLDLDKRGLLLITGHSLDEGGANGSGKSSLSNKGLLWTLYGSTASGERADAAINRFAEADSTCVGLLDLESNSGNQYRVVRSRCPNRLSVVDLSTGADISCKTEKETQALINKIVGRTRETFLQTDFFGQGKLAAFLDLTPKAQVELLETILPFDRLAELAEKTKDYLSQLGTVHSSVERKIAEKTGHQMEAQRQERVLSEAIDKWEQEKDLEKRTLEAKIAELENGTVAKKMGEWEKTLLSLPNVKECIDVADACQGNLRAIDESIKKFRYSENEWRLVKSRLRPTKLPPGPQTCPTCEQMISLGLESKLIAEHKAYHAQVAQADEALKLCADEIGKLEAGKQQHYDRWNEANRIQNQIAEVETEYAKAQQDTAELAILREKLATVKLEVNPYTALYVETSKKVNLTIQALSLHKARLDEVDKDQYALTFWRDAFGKELKNEFISQVCPFLERRANDHLDGLGNGQLKVSVSTRKLLKSDEARSEFTISAVSSTGGGSYDSLSGGERQLVNFAVGLALADLAELQTDGPSYFQVLDEPFMALDSRNAENLVNYLNSYLKGKKETILLVSNEEALKNLIPNRIHVVKENGVTRIAV